MAGEAYSEVVKRLNSGKFVVTGELEPVKTTDLSEVLQTAETIKDHVIAVNVTDNPTAFAYFSTLMSCYLIQEKTGLETVYQVTVRDRNRLALTSDLLAAGGLGLKNVLALSGDFISIGDNPQAKPVYDLDSAQLVFLIRKMVDEGIDLAGNKIEEPPKFHVCVAANPNTEPLEPELYKLLRKQNVGAEFVQTQCVYDVEVLDKFLGGCKSVGIKMPILIGVAPLKSVKMLDWMVKFVPGITIPQDVQTKLRNARERSKEAFKEANLEVFGKLCKQIGERPGVAGLHMMAIGFEEVIPDILEYAGINM